MASTPRISVVMICHNHEKYIQESVESILSQTDHDFELIIVDDGSTDNTGRIIKEYDDSRLVLVQQENSGPSAALNAGIDRSRGQFIAFMSGDDVSHGDRLTTQFHQIESHKADIVFCLPEIIGPKSEALSPAMCPRFFGKDFRNTADLYRILFYDQNFLCAPSAFCRRTAIDEIGRFRRGLIQLQDFDYWIRACNKELVIRLFKDPLMQYRHLYGRNLSDSRNLNRTRTEAFHVYRHFFDQAPVRLLQEAFGQSIHLSATGESADVEIDKSLLLLHHPDPLVRIVGAERIIGQIEDDSMHAKLKQERELDAIALFRLTNEIDAGSALGTSNIRRALGTIRVWLGRALRFVAARGPIWNERRAEKQIRSYLDKGDYKRALLLIWGSRPHLAARRLLFAIRMLPGRIWRPPWRALTYATRVLAAQIGQLVGTKVLELERLYDYCLRRNSVLYEDAPERVRIRRPRVVGDIACELAEGEAMCPPAYVSTITAAVVTGGSSLVVSHEGLLLHDEMVDFPGENFGLKSPYVRFRHQDKVILGYSYRPGAVIKEGILLSCDHDANYFHWLVECLPKLLMVNSLPQLEGVPLLVPTGLHQNLERALERVNVSERRVIRLDPGVGYRVRRLIYPSPLSRILDRYGGQLVFDEDIVLSHKWISKVARALRNNAPFVRKPWRRLYLARRHAGLRSLENEEELERLMLEHNFEIVALDDVSLDFQIELFSQAAMIVAPTGAALTNMLFCQPGAKVIIFMSNHDITNYYFWSQLGDIAGLDVEILAGERLYNLTNRDSVHDDYRVDPTIVLQELRRLIPFSG